MNDITKCNCSSGAKNTSSSSSKNTSSSSNNTTILVVATNLKAKYRSVLQIIRVMLSNLSLVIMIITFIGRQHNVNALTKNNIFHTFYKYVK